MPMMAKTLADVSRDDLAELLRGPWIEDEQLDFKVTIPHKDGDGRDPWRNAATPEARRIKEHGRDQLLAALVAFANSYGGDLIVGVREVRDSKPGAAEAFDPLPACEDAAHRLAQMATECIEPPLTALQVRGIPFEAGGSGVVILRTPRSRMAPHRLKTTKDCYHRVRHETLPMTMRQMQDLTFNVARGLGAVERRLDAARRSFQQWLQESGRPPNTHRLGLRLTAVPLSGDLYIEHVHGVQAVQPGQRNARLRPNPAPPDYPLTVPFTVHNWRPVLRGTEAHMQNDHSRARLGVYCDGTIMYEWIRDVHENGQRPYLLYPGWYFAVVVNAVEAAEKFRVAAGAAAAEYALAAELVASTTLPVTRLGNAVIDPAGSFPAGSHDFPRYPIGPPASFRETYALVYRDFWNSIGIDAQEDDFLLDV
jgi:hypothetical protein